MNRPTKLKRFFFLASLPLAVGLNAQTARQPTILFILTDDMGIGDLSGYGGTILPTPNIDRMAAEGIRFTQYYSASPISSASRAGLMTGRYPGHWNITSYLQSRAGNREAEMADYLLPEAPTLPGALKTAGYKTAHFGKWHLGGGRDVNDAPSIRQYGYDEYASTYESPDPDPLLTAKDWIWSAQDSIPRWNRTAYFVDKTLDFLRKHRGESCFINLWPDDVHTPWIGNKEELAVYPANENSEKNFRTVMGEYDRQIGRLLTTLRQEGLDRNIVVIFTSDNGPAPSFHSRTNQLRGCKASLFEGGVRMPLIVWSPDLIKTQGVVDETSVICAMDMFNSLCAIGHSPLPEKFKGDGQDRSKSLLGKPQKRRKPIFWEYKRNESKAFPKANGRDNSPNVSVRDGDWKLLVNDNGTNTMLFNLKHDVSEKENVAGRYPEIAERLKKCALNWRQSLPALPRQTK